MQNDEVMHATSLREARLMSYAYENGRRDGLAVNMAPMPPKIVCRCSAIGMALALAITGVVIWPLGFISQIIVLRNVSDLHRMHPRCKSLMGIAAVFSAIEGMATLYLVAYVIWLRH